MLQVVLAYPLQFYGNDITLSWYDYEILFQNFFWKKSSNKLNEDKKYDSLRKCFLSIPFKGLVFFQKFLQKTKKKVFSWDRIKLPSGETVLKIFDRILYSLQICHAIFVAPKHL